MFKNVYATEKLSRVNLARQVVDWTTLNLGNRFYVLNGYHCNLFFNQSKKPI